jgi:hypothetical protein
LLLAPKIKTNTNVICVVKMKHIPWLLATKTRAQKLQDDEEKMTHITWTFASPNCINRQQGHD